MKSFLGVSALFFLLIVSSAFGGYTPCIPQFAVVGNAERHSGQPGPYTVHFTQNSVLGENASVTVDRDSAKIELWGYREGGERNIFMTRQAGTTKYVGTFQGHSIVLDASILPAGKRGKSWVYSFSVDGKEIDYNGGDL